MHINVCLPCTKEQRYPACHDSCPKYLKQRAELNKQNEIKAKHRESYRRSPVSRHRNSMWKTSMHI